MTQSNAAREAQHRRDIAAQVEVARRLTLALDRLRVSRDGIPAQFLHAVHYLDRGWAGDSRDVPAGAPDFSLGHERAEELALILHSMLMWAANAKTTVGEAS